jgi:hypothetical protein
MTASDVLLLQLLLLLVLLLLLLLVDAHAAVYSCFVAARQPTLSVTFS